MATEEEILELTGFPLGAVSPFGTRQPVRTLVDRTAIHEEEISVGSGVRYTTVIMRRDGFLRALGAVEIGDFAAKEDDIG